MSTIQQPVKPIFKAPEQKPFKPANEPALAVAAPPPKDGEWKPIDTAPQDPMARFLVRASVNGKLVGGTEMLVRYRASRKMVGKKWQPALTIIDDRLLTKLGFRPTEWCEASEAMLNSSTWDGALKKAAEDAQKRKQNV